MLTGFLANCSSVLGPQFWILDGTFGHTDKVRKKCFSTVTKRVTCSVSLGCSIRLRFVVLLQLVGFGIMDGAINSLEAGAHVRNRAKGISV